MVPENQPLHLPNAERQASKLQLPLLAFDPGSTGPGPEALPTVLTREVFYCAMFHRDSSIECHIFA